MIVACTQNKHNNAFYFWKSNYSLSETEQKVLKENQINTMYVHFFDVQWNIEKNAPIPVNTVTFSDTIAYSIIPVIYIDNKVMEKITDSNIDTLSKNILQLINLIATKYHLSYHEVQLDCDWTLGTKQHYFSLLEDLKNHLNHSKQLSATIRLHQVKYKDKTGVPPVDKAVIMYYNMGDLEKKYETNSILNNIIAKKYVSHLSKYPLPYDVALPLFSWSVVFRNGKVIALKSAITEAELKNDTLFQKTNINHFIAKQSFFMHGLYLKEGDDIRLEIATYNDIINALNDIKDNSKTHKYNIILYHLNTDDIKRIGHEKIKQIYNHR